LAFHERPIQPSALEAGSRGCEHLRVGIQSRHLASEPGHGKREGPVPTAGIQDAAMGYVTGETEHEALLESLGQRSERAGTP
jgi:hypothetical protein